jgi:hypothetical protein
MDSAPHSTLRVTAAVEAARRDYKQVLRERKRERERERRLWGPGYCDMLYMRARFYVESPKNVAQG